MQLPFYDNPNVDPDMHWNHSFSGNTSKFSDPSVPDGSGPSYTVPRTTDGHTLAGGTVNVATGFDVAGESSFALVGNPFMTTIDFDALQLQPANNNLIKRSYLIWTEVGAGLEGYICYNPNGISGIINPTTPSTDKLIAPLQGFIVEQNGSGGGTGDLNFNLAAVASGTKGTLRSAPETNNKLDIIAANDKASVLTYIAKREDGTEQFGESDSRKLSNGLSEVPDIYTLKQSDNGTVAVGANITNSDDIEYPLVLATTFDGEISFTFSGMDSYDAKIFFIDKVSDEIIELTDMSTYEYKFDYTPPQNGAEIISTEDRFYIRISTRSDDNETGGNEDSDDEAGDNDETGDETGDDEADDETGDNETDDNETGDDKTGDTTLNEITDKQSLFAYAKEGAIYTVSNEDNIQEIRIYSLQGIVLYQSIVNDKSHTTTKKFAPGVYVVNIKTENNIISKKVIINQ